MKRLTLLFALILGLFSVSGCKWERTIHYSYENYLTYHQQSLTLEPTFKDLEGYFIVRCYGDWEEGCDEWFSVSCESDGTLKIWLAENNTGAARSLFIVVDIDTPDYAFTTVTLFQSCKE